MNVIYIAGPFRAENAWEIEQRVFRLKGKADFRARNREKIAAHQREYYLKNRETILAKVKITKRWRAGHLKKYGLTVAAFEQMLKSQRGLCFICGPNGEGKMCVDHNHQTGQVRRLLCDRCNRMIGAAREDPMILRAAARYLTDFQPVGKKTI